MIKPGDAIAFETRGLFARLIRWGQRHPGKNGNWWYNHMALVESVGSNDVRLIQAVRTVERAWLGSYVDITWKHIPFPGSDERRADVVAYGQKRVGMKYGIALVISRALQYLTPKWVHISIERNGRADCSVFVARSWEHGGWDFGPTVDVGTLTPADEVDAYGGEAQ